MREILFRGKTMPKKSPYEFDNIWVYGDLIRSGGKCYIHPSSNVVVTNGEIGQLIIMHEVVPETVSQWTGLVDKNRVKIFDGDVVCGEDINGIVQYNATHAAFLVLEKSATLGLRYFYLDDFVANKCTVISNVYDNPEFEIGKPMGY